MHESVLASSLLSIVLEEAEKYAGAGALRVISIDLELGLFSCVEEQTLQGCFALLAEDSAARGARLNARRRPLPGLCAGCGAELEIRRRDFACPRCGSRQVDWKDDGHAMRITGIEVSENRGVQ
ncbi:MAG: hydrogenase maturation nickel metallochaperone HypA [Desulfovibrionaceae bacterium]|nr:hydrogenase maturation nickel metallochaperone HypA [Desulfovibrionaceae bacterium]